MFRTDSAAQILPAACPAPPVGLHSALAAHALMISASVLAVPPQNPNQSASDFESGNWLHSLEEQQLAPSIPDVDAQAGWAMLVVVVAVVVVCISVSAVHCSAAVSAVDLFSVSLSCVFGEGLVMEHHASVKYTG